MLSAAAAGCPRMLIVEASGRLVGPPVFKSEDPRYARRHLEGSGRLVGPLVFKTSVPVKSWQAGSIPVPLRHAWRGNPRANGTV